MLHSVRTIATIPDGLMKAKVDLVRGMIVSRTLDGLTKEYEITLPTGHDDENIYGFVTLREDESIYARSEYDKIEKGKRAVVYTLVKNEEWATDQVDGFSTLEIGDKLYAASTGKLTKVSSAETPIAIVIGKRKALSGYEKDTVIVKIV